MIIITKICNSIPVYYYDYYDYYDYYYDYYTIIE